MTSVLNENTKKEEDGEWTFVMAQKIVMLQNMKMPLGLILKQLKISNDQFEKLQSTMNKIQQPLPANK